MIDEGDLKEGDKVVNEYDVTYIVTSVTEDDQIKYCLAIEDNIKYNIKDYPLSPALQFRTFTIKEKEYLTFDEARKIGTPFHIKTGYNYGASAYCSEEFIEEMDKKVWEVKN